MRPRGIFNSDLLVRPEERAAADQLYPRISKFLDWQDCRNAFAYHEREAKELKATAQRRGIYAVLAGLLAMWLAAIEPPLHALHLPLLGQVALAGLGLALAVLGIFLGGGVLRGRSKAEWLHHRAAAERLRALTFQWLVRRVLEIASVRSNEMALMQERDKILLHTKSALRLGSADVVARTIDDPVAKDCWLVSERGSSHADIDPESIDQLFAAYEDLRIRHQLDFATKNLSSGQGFWPWEPKGRAERLSLAGVALIAIVVFVHIAILGSVVVEGVVQGLLHYPPLLPGLPSLLQTIALVAAVTVLGVRVLEDGFRPHDEIERYRDYRSEAADIHTRFTSTTVVAEKIHQMERMEKLVYRELRQFLASHDAASFVL